MSFFVIPTQEAFEHRRAPVMSGGCGASARSFAAPRLDPFTDTNAIPRSLLGALLGVSDTEEDEDQGFAHLHPWQQHQVEQLRRQEYLREVQRRQRILQAKRQQQQLYEQERQRRREQAQRERERAVRLAILHREHQRRAYEEYQQQQAAAALEYQRREEAYRRRRQQQQQQQEFAKRHEHDWEQTLFGVINLAQRLFGEDEKDTFAGQPSVPAAEKKKEEVREEQAQPTEARDINTESKGQAEESPLVATEPTSTPAPAAQEAKTGRLLFIYPLPTDESIRTNIQAKDIAVSFDEESRTIQLSGLWHNDTSTSDAGSSTVGSDDTTRGRKRSRSPKRSRVSDYDEKTGEEIPKPEDGGDDDEEFFEVTKEQPKSTPITKAIRLPEDADVQGLRAEITDDGFQVWI